MGGTEEGWGEDGRGGGDRGLEGGDGGGVGVGRGGGFEEEADEFAAAGDAGPVEELVWRG